MKRELFTLIILTLLTCKVYSQSKTEIRNELNQLKIELNQLKSENAILKAKIETSEANHKLLQLEVENLKSKANYQPESGTSNEVKDSKIDKSDFKSNPTPPKSYSGQCKATTKKGTRCSRSAKSNGYCWQHGGN